MSRKPRPHEMALNRRKMVALLGASGAAGAAGCLGDGDDESDDGTPTPTPSDDDGGDDGMDDDGGDDGMDDGGDDGGDDDVAGDDTPDDPELVTEGQLLGPDGNQVELTVVYTTGTESYETVAELIAQGLNEVGIAANIEGLEWGPGILAQVVANNYTGDGEPEWNFPNNAGPRDKTQSEFDWDIHYGINFNSYPRTPASTDVFWKKDGPVNYMGYYPSSDLASLYEDLQKTADPEARQELVNEILLTLNRDQPVNFVAMPDDLTGYNERINGPEEKFGGNWDSNTWYFDDQSVGGDYVSGIGGDAQTLYFPGIADTTSASFVGLTMDGAYAVNSNNEVEPLWMDLTDSGDGQVYVAELRDNLQWGGDYGQMTAEDWVYYITEVQEATKSGDEKTNWALSNSQPDWAPIENIEQTSDLEFQVELGSVTPTFPQQPVLWGSYCAPMDLFEEFRPNGEELKKSDVIQQLQYTGNLGPYDYNNWARGDRFTVDRADEYYMRDADDRGSAWDNAPYFETYTLRIIEEEATRLQALKAGEIDSAGLPEARVQEFREQVDNVYVNQTPQPFTRVMAMNQRANGWAEFRKTEIRQAMSMILDKEVVTQQILRGLAKFSHTHQPKWSPWWSDTLDEEIIEFGVGDTQDFQRARNVLAEHTSDDYEYSG